MKFKCRVITRSSRNEVLGIDNLNQLNLDFKNKSREEFPFLKIYLTATPIKGKANKELIKLLSKKLNISKSKISIIKGERNKEKIIEINE